MNTVSKNTSKVQTKSPVKEQFIVAIGASAGGLEAIHEFFDHMPGDANFAFVVIQHLSPDYKSLLVELVSKHTHMKVFEAANNMTLQPDCVYIIPNNKLMTISKNKLKLADKSAEKAPNTAIDHFLVTLAHEKRDKAIAIILSGTGTDGTKGIEAIKECGGLVIVQEPSTAKFDGMPNSAITSGNADHILPPHKMHEEIYNHTNQEPVKVLENGKLDDSLLEEIFSMVHKTSGHDFNLYKTPTIVRRIARRMTAHNIKTLPEYVDLLRVDAGEVKVLGKDFLIGVTKFFRDKAAFEILANEVIPAMVKNKDNGEVLKVWVCACSTGEEAYSIAVLINDHLDKVKKRLDVKIFATDIDESSIDIASKNLYPALVAKEIPATLLKKYFVKEGKYYSVLPEIRKQIVFAKHNVIKAPPFIKNDLVTCRNMLIYMNNLLQQKVLSTFHFALNSGGYLFLGSSETVSTLKDGLKEINSKWKVYQKNGKLDYSPSTYQQQILPPSHEKNQQARTPEPAAKGLEEDFRDFLVDDIGFVGIFINRNYEIKETIGDFKKYLSLPDKKLDLNLLKMVPREVSVILNTAIRKAWKDNKKTHLNRMRIRRDNEDIFLNISVKPPEQTSASPYTLIVFSESWTDGATEKDDSIISSADHHQNNEYVIELEAELNETRNSLQMAVEEMETTNEELQSSNEELLSANEELQSSNEELQSLNEELHTLNTEHQLKIKELIELNDDLDNYFKSTDIGQIFLDGSLRIRKFNPAVVDMVNLIDADIGRPLSHISNNIKYDNLINDVNFVLKHGTVVEKEILVDNGKRSLMRIMPYVRKDKRNDGVVISFVDISVITELNNIITGVFNASNNAIMAFKAVRDGNGRITDFKCAAANRSATDVLKKTEEDLQDAVMVKQLPELTNEGFFDKYVKVVETGRTLQGEYRLDEREYNIVAVKMADGFAVTFADITQRKASELKLKKNFNDLVAAREDLRKLNTGLETMVKERTLELTQSEERFKLVSKATNDTIWDWNLVNNTMWRSENFTSMFGYHIDEETENIRFWFEKVHPDDRARVEKSVYDAINNGKKQWSAEYRFLKADNTYAIILDRGSILHDDFKTPYRMVGSIIDVTRLMEAERRLSSSENRFRRIFESNMIGMLFSDRKGHIVEANDALLDMIGYTREDLHSGKIKWRDITPEEYQEVSNWAVNQLEQHGVCPPFEKQYITKQGKRVSILMGSALLNEGEHYSVSYIINITEQKETQKRQAELRDLIKKQQEEFYSIFMNAPALITIRRGKDLTYEFTNKAFDEFDGRAPYIGKTSFEAHPERRGGRLTEIDKHVVKTGESYVGKAFHFQRIDPETKQLIDSWWDFLFTPVFNEQAEVDGIAFFGFDVTDLIKAQQATRQLMQKKDEFMSIASHELKTPITSLKGSLQIASRLASKNGDIKTLWPFIEKADRQTSKLTALVDDLLDVTRIQEGKMLFNYTNFNAGDMIRECMEEVQANNSSHKIELVGDADKVIHADRPRLEQVVSNFLSNAIKYSPEASKVVVSAEVNNNMLKISVRDFGIGIPNDKKEYVFDRFFRVQESSHKFSGLGLGLYISAEIIKRHHGKIGVESVENEGSTFWFQLPVSNN